ncbi:DUF4352 domain-containing protein [Lederbergia citrea]|uniref:DUF4352 domain-containing protein n=1 Tax=Lederbergia citrea TaxID=2833581 RepID=A0A942UI09_9BACI|nr:DUF4352 domain-containing protein [Lederbergia citrea]MBS4221830.1 DUF4352 domain-containing protein [Lederbergia citrea]
MIKFGKVVFMGVVVGGFLAGCGEADVQKVDNGTQKQEQKVDKKEEKKEQKNEFKIGETASVDGMEVTINNISYVDPAEYLDTEQDKVLRLDVSVKNNAADNGFVDTSEFQVYSGDEKSEFYFGHDKSNLGGGELKKGKSLKMTLDFDVPESDAYEIFYEPSFSFKDNAEIKFNVSKGDIK